MIEDVMGRLSEMLEEAPSGYIVVIYTGTIQMITTEDGEEYNATTFHVIGPFNKPEDHVVQIANILDKYSETPYNIQTIKGKFTSPEIEVIPYIYKFVSCIAKSHE